MLPTSNVMHPSPSMDVLGLRSTVCQYDDLDTYQKNVASNWVAQTRQTIFPFPTHQNHCGLSTI